MQPNERDSLADLFEEGRRFLAKLDATRSQFAALLGQAEKSVESRSPVERNGQQPKTISEVVVKNRVRPKPPEPEPSLIDDDDAI